MPNAAVLALPEFIHRRSFSGPIEGNREHGRSKENLLTTDDRQYILPKKDDCLRGLKKGGTTNVTPRKTNVGAGKRFEHATKITN